MLTTDLLLGEKLLDEGKQLGLMGTDVVDSLQLLDLDLKGFKGLDLRFQGLTWF